MLSPVLAHSLPREGCPALPPCPAPPPLWLESSLLNPEPCPLQQITFARHRTSMRCALPLQPRPPVHIMCGVLLCVALILPRLQHFIKAPTLTLCLNTSSNRPARSSAHPSPSAWLHLVRSSSRASGRQPGRQAPWPPQPPLVAAPCCHCHRCFGCCWGAGGGARSWAPDLGAPAPGRTACCGTRLPAVQAPAARGAQTHHEAGCVGGA